MYDMHCHILPGVDDGPISIDEAINMAIMAKTCGIQAIFATPHYIEGVEYPDAIFNKKVFDNLNYQLFNRGIDIKIYFGNEVYSTPNIINLLEKGHVATLNNSNYMLIELPMHDMPVYIESIIYNLKLKNITPIIAHPERNSKIIEDPNVLYDFISRGTLAQLNLPSLLGMYGESVKKTARILLKHNMIHFVGTDAHRPRNRYYNIKESVDILSSIIGKEKTLKIIRNNPESIVEKTNIEIDEPKIYKPYIFFRTKYIF